MKRWRATRTASASGFDALMARSFWWALKGQRVLAKTDLRSSPGVLRGISRAACELRHHAQK